MCNRRYALRHDPGAFETGTAQGKQLLLANTVHEILLHWFAPNGEFIELERHPIPKGSGASGRVWSVKTGTVLSEPAPGYWQRVEREVNALKERIGFVAQDIAVCKFESEEACIEDLPGEYQEFLDNREDYSAADQLAFDEYIRKWRSRDCFVLEFCEQYWMSATGEVEHS
jgi:hypothetical protein